MFSSTPSLPHRDGPIEQFCTYLILENSNGHLTLRWKSEPALKSNIELYKNRHKQFASLYNQPDRERGLVRFWLEMALHDQPPKEEWEPANRGQLALQHLTCYCESSCYSAAKQIGSRNQYLLWDESLYIAKCVIYDAVKFKQLLAKYDATQASLKTYVIVCLERAIQDEATSTVKFSRWRLLDREKDKMLRAALERDGRREPEISRFLFARKYFKKVYQINKVQNPTKRTGSKWPEPDSQDFQEAAECYNAEKLLPSASHEVSTGAELAGEQLKNWMELCIAALQNYPNRSQPPHLAISLEVRRQAGQEIGAEESVGIWEPEWPGSVEAEESDKNQESLISRAEEALQQQLLSLKPDQQRILILYYGTGLTQKQLAASFGISQSALSHRMSTIKMKLLKTLAGLSQPAQWVTEYVAGWLERDYQTPLHSDLIHAVLVEAIKKLDAQEREALRLFYGQQVGGEEMACRLGIAQPAVSEMLRSSKAKLEAALVKGIDKHIKQYVEIWLAKISRRLVELASQEMGASSIKEACQEQISAVCERCLVILRQSNQGG